MRIALLLDPNSYSDSAAALHVYNPCSLLCDAVNVVDSTERAMYDIQRLGKLSY